MNDTEDIDRALVRWQEQAFNRRQARSVKVRGLTGMSLPRKQAPTTPVTACNVRNHLNGMARRRPQVLVRISGGGKGMRHIMTHLVYISRNGRLTLEDQNGEMFHGTDDMNAMRAEWQCGGIPIADVSMRREAFNVVLSMPPGTDANRVHAAAREFAHDEFAGHQFALVLHTETNDPNRSPAANPHVHLCVKVTRDDGVRLNPRKDDLRHWRGRFAEKLREHGVDAAASSRLERFQPVRGRKQADLRMQARDTQRSAIGRPSADAAKIERARQVEAAMLSRYADLARVLARSPLDEDRILATGLVGLCGHTRVIDRTIEQGRER